MKTTTWLIFALVVSVGFLRGAVCAAQNSDSQSAAHSSTPTHNGVPDLDLARPPAHAMPNNNSRHALVPVASVNREHGNGAHDRPLRTKNSSTIEKMGMEPSRTAGQTRPVAVHSVTRFHQPLLSVRHRTSNPAVIGGPAIANNKNGRVLDGARISRKP